MFEALKDWVLTVSMDNSIDFSSDMNIANNAASTSHGAPQVFEACAGRDDKICCITGNEIILMISHLLFQCSSNDLASC